MTGLIASISLCLSLFVCLSVSVCLSLSLSLSLLSVHLSVSLSPSLSLSLLSVHLSLCLFLSFCLSVCLSFSFLNHKRKGWLLVGDTDVLNAPQTIVGWWYWCSECSTNHCWLVILMFWMLHKPLLVGDTDVLNAPQTIVGWWYWCSECSKNHCPAWCRVAGSILLWDSERGDISLGYHGFWLHSLKNSFGWEYKPRSSLCTHAFHSRDSKDPDIHVLDGWMRQQKHTQYTPSVKTECYYLYGWIKKNKKRSHVHKSHPKWWSPEIQLGIQKKKKKQAVLTACGCPSFCHSPDRHVSSVSSPSCDFCTNHIICCTSQKHLNRYI